mmetsp:Transcript_28082/g.86883  ORF Transcript_28082/g.86883 Transcript_28082/m.86883 type:complete len:145 (+) Transcript_28082:621-1055(+)
MGEVGGDPWHVVDAAATGLGLAYQLWRAVMELRPLRLLAFFALAAAAAVCGAAPGPRKQLAPSIASAASATLYAASLDRGALERVPLAAIFLLSVHGAVIVLESRDARAARRASESPDAGSTRLIRTVLAEHAPVADGLSVRDR